MFLGVDCGTQGTKALLIDESGAAMGRGYAGHEIVERSSGSREQEPPWWVAAIKLAVRQAVSSVRSTVSVEAMGVSGQQHGLVVLDANQRVIRPAKLWNDTETARENTELIRHFGGPEEFFRRFGIVPLPGYTVSKLLWLSKHEPENFNRIRHILLPHEYLNFWLTGNMRAEHGDASGTAFFDVRSREWIREILDFIDGGSGHLFAALPELIRSDDFVGSLSSHSAFELGLPEECLVASGGGDNMMGAIGTGNVRQGVVTLSLGTSSTVYSYSDRPASDPTGNVAPFCSSTGGWLPLVCTMNATNVVTSTVELLGKSVKDIDEALIQTQPGADGLVMLPFLNGERTPDLPNGRGSLSGISAINFTPQHLIRAAVEGVSFGILNGLDLVLEGSSSDVVQVIGGGARSRAWRQLLADATGAVIKVPAEEEAGCLGAAVQAIVALSKRLGTAQTFEEVTDRLVTHKEAETCVPNPDLRSAYVSARLNYRRTLAKYMQSDAAISDN